MASLRGNGCVSNAQLPPWRGQPLCETLHIKTFCVSVATPASVFPLDACVSVMTVQTRNTARRRAGRQLAPRSASACCRDSSRRSRASGGGSVWSYGRARRSAVGSPC